MAKVYLESMRWNILSYLLFEGFLTSPVIEQFADIGKMIQMTCPDKKSGTWQKLESEDMLASCENGNLTVNPKILHKIHITEDCQNLTIKVLKKEDFGMYRCYITSSDAAVQMYDFDIKIRSITIVEANHSSSIKREEGEYVTLTCLIHGAQPDTVVYWTVGGTILRTNKSTYVTYQFTTKPSDHMKQFVCNANSSEDSYSLEAKVQLRIIFKPNVAVVSNPSPPTVRKGHNITLLCQDESGNDKIINSFSWIQHGRLLNIDTNTLHIVRADPDVDGEYICNVKNIAGEDFDDVKVTITYPPVVRNYSVAFKTNDRPITLHCEAKGVPNAYKFSEWRHYIHNDQLVRNLQGYTNGTLILPHDDDQEDLTYENSGIYICNVTNDIPDEDGHLWKTGKVEVIIEGIPILRKPKKYSYIGYFNETSSVSIFVLSSSNVLKADWFDERQLLLNTSTCSSHVIDTEFFGQLFNVPSYKCEYVIQITTKEDFQNYSVNIANRFGKTAFNFSLESASQPKEPTNIRLQSTTNHIHVEFHPGFDGGSPQTFIIEYRKASSLAWIWLEIENSLKQYCIKNLDPSTEYELRMYARNKLGNSSFTDIYIILTKDKINSSGTKYIGFVLAFTFTVCILVTWWRLRKEKRNDSQRFRANEQQIQGVHVGVIVNNLYGSAVDLHGSSSASASSSAGRTDVYSSIDRRTEILDKQEVTYKIAGQGKQKFQLTDRKGRKRHTESGSSKLNYIDVVFEPKPHIGKLYIHGADNRTPYADIDFSAKAEPLSSSDENDESSTCGGNNVDDFVSLEDVQQWNITED